MGATESSATRSKRMRRRLAGAVAAATTLVVLVGCSSSGDSPGSGGGSDPYRIGIENDITGGAASTGAPNTEGIQTAIDEVNKAGGVNGKQIKLYVTDSKLDAGRARLNVQTLINDKVLAILGGVEIFWQSLAPLAAQHEVSTFTIGANDNLIEPPQPYIYSIQLGAAGNVTTQIRFAQQYLQKHGLTSTPKVAIERFETSYTDDMLTAFKDQLGALNWPILTDQNFQTSATSALAQASAIANSHPDVVFAAYIDSQAPFAVRELRAAGYKGPIVDFIGASASATFNGLKDPGYYSARSFAVPNDSTIPATKAMLAAAKAAGHTQNLDNPFFTEGYVTGKVLVQALKKCGADCSGSQLNDALNNLGTFDTQNLSGPVTLSPKQHRAVSSVRFYVYDSGAGGPAPVGDYISGS
jgi:branched-chain amino acid transport system substrate-binding protein